MDENLFLKSGCFLASVKDNTVWWQSHSSQNAKAKESGISFYCNDFFLKQPHPWLLSSACHKCNMDEFRSKTSGLKKSKPAFVFDAVDFDSHKQQYTELMIDIKCGKLFKGVPYAVQNGKGIVTQENIAYFLFSLFSQNLADKMYLYGHWNLESQQMIMGITPELIFEQNQNTIKTAAIAGTFTDQCNEMDKIIAEHNVVIDDIAHALESQGLLHIGSTEKMDMGMFSHLRTDLCLSVAQQKKISFEKVLTALHPTAALGAFPRAAGKQWLESVEKKSKPRGYYGGVFGVSNQSTFSLCVGMIRCLQWDCGQLSLIAGGGVIAQSDLTKEQAEIAMKIQSIKNNFGLCND